MWDQTLIAPLMFGKNGEKVTLAVLVLDVLILFWFLLFLLYFVSREKLKNQQLGEGLGTRGRFGEEEEEEVVEMVRSEGIKDRKRDRRNQKVMREIEKELREILQSENEVVICKNGQSERKLNTVKEIDQVKF